MHETDHITFYFIQISILILKLHVHASFKDYFTFTYKPENSNALINKRKMR